jgi:colicin import membrane protein
MAESKAKAKEDGKTVIRPNTENYTKSKSASGKKTMHNGDPVAVLLDGATLDETLEMASAVLDTPTKELQAKYGHLNIGQQRMNLGNRIRGALNRHEKENEGKGESWLKKQTGALRKAIDARLKAEADEKAAKAKEAKSKAA